MASYEALLQRFPHRQIRGCPGRWVLSDHRIALISLAEGAVWTKQCDVESAHDRVYVVRLLSGGVISYQKDDLTFVHTVNSEEGFSRKLKMLGIPDCPE